MYYSAFTQVEITKTVQLHVYKWLEYTVCSESCRALLNGSMGDSVVSWDGTGLRWHWFCLFVGF